MGKEPSTFAQLDFTNIKQLSRFLHTEEILSSILKFNINCKHFFLWIHFQIFLWTDGCEVPYSSGSVFGQIRWLFFMQYLIPSVMLGLASLKASFIMHYKQTNNANQLSNDRTSHPILTPTYVIHISYNSHHSLKHPLARLWSHPKPISWFPRSYAGADWAHM